MGMNKVVMSRAVPTVVTHWCSVGMSMLTVAQLFVNLKLKSMKFKHLLMLVKVNSIMQVL